jgi:predicted 3-demethylubiquinone-9 3-methyltransferase (glyoxalase superfamily)
MPTNRQKVSTCLWFDTDAEEAATFYTSILENSRITAVSRRSGGQALMVEFELAGVAFQALNGGPHFRLSEACSLSVACDTQEEIDRLWTTLVADGGEEGQCGWLKDRFGLSWQIVPTALRAMMTDSDPSRVARVVAAFMPMKKLDLAELEAAFRGA